MGPEPDGEPSKQEAPAVAGEKPPTEPEKGEESPPPPPRRPLLSACFLAADALALYRLTASCTSDGLFH